MLREAIPGRWGSLRSPPHTHKCGNIAVVAITVPIERASVPFTRPPYILPYMATSKTTIYLDADEYLQLQRLARERGTSAALLIREAVADYTARNVKAVRPKSIGMGRSRRTTLGTDSEKLLKGFGGEK